MERGNVGGRKREWPDDEESNRTTHQLVSSSSANQARDAAGASLDQISSAVVVHQASLQHHPLLAQSLNRVRGSFTIRGSSGTTNLSTANHWAQATTTRPSVVSDPVTEFLLWKLSRSERQHQGTAAPHLFGDSARHRMGKHQSMIQNSSSVHNQHQGLAHQLSRTENNNNLNISSMLNMMQPSSQATPANMLLTTQEIDYLLPSGGRFALPALLSRPLSNQQQLAGTNRLLGDDRQAILTALNRSLSGPLRFGSRPPNNVAFENSSMIDSPFFSQVSSAMGGTSHITAAARQKLPPASGQQIASRSINEGARSSDIGVVVAPAAAAIHDSQRVLASASPAAINRGTPSSSNKSFMIYTPNDEDNLTAYQCLARKYIEFFETNEDDLNAGHQGRNKPIVLKQVGIRCCLCANLPHRQKSRAHSYYPSHIVGIYQAAQNIASAHLNKFCQCVPGDLRRELLRLYAEKTISKGGKKYWATSARALGVCEAEDGGLRFDGGRVDEETSLNRETGKDEGVTK